MANVNKKLVGRVQPQGSCLSQNKYKNTIRPPEKYLVL